MPCPGGYLASWSLHQPGTKWTLGWWMSRQHEAASWKRFLICERRSGSTWQLSLVLSPTRHSLPLPASLPLPCFPPLPIVCPQHDSLKEHLKQESLRWRQHRWKLLMAPLSPRVKYPFLTTARCSSMWPTSLPAPECQGFLDPLQCCHSLLSQGLCAGCPSAWKALSYCFLVRKFFFKNFRLFLAVLDLPCCASFPLAVASGSCSLGAVRWLLITAACLAEHGR